MICELKEIHNRKQAVKDPVSTPAPMPLSLEPQIQPHIRMGLSPLPHLLPYCSALGEKRPPKACVFEHMLRKLLLFCADGNVICYLPCLLGGLPHHDGLYPSLSCFWSWHFTTAAEQQRHA